MEGTASSYTANQYVSVEIPDPDVTLPPQPSEQPDKALDTSQTKQNTEEQHQQLQTIQFKHAGGRPTKYSEDMLVKAKKYFDRCYGKIDGRLRMPFIEELALELEVDEDTILAWKNKKNEDGTLTYPEFSATYSRIFLLQKLRLMQSGLSGKSPSFTMFLLSANHGLFSAEKRVLSAENTEPIQIVIVEDKPIHTQNGS